MGFSAAGVAVTVEAGSGTEAAICEGGGMRGERQALGHHEKRWLEQGEWGIGASGTCVEARRFGACAPLKVSPPVVVQDSLSYEQHICANNREDEMRCWRQKR